MSDINFVPLTPSNYSVQRNAAVAKIKSVKHNERQATCASLVLKLCSAHWEDEEISRSIKEMQRDNMNRVRQVVEFMDANQGMMAEIVGVHEAWNVTDKKSMLRGWDLVRKAQNLTMRPWADDKYIGNERDGEMHVGVTVPGKCGLLTRDLIKVNADMRKNRNLMMGLSADHERGGSYDPQFYVRVANALEAREKTETPMPKDMMQKTSSGRPRLQNALGSLKAHEHKAYAARINTAIDHIKAMNRDSDRELIKMLTAGGDDDQFTFYANQQSRNLLFIVIFWLKYIAKVQGDLVVVIENLSRVVRGTNARPQDLRNAFTNSGDADMQRIGNALSTQKLNLNASPLEISPTRLRNDISVFEATNSYHVIAMCSPEVTTMFIAMVNTMEAEAGSGAGDQRLSFRMTGRTQTRGFQSPYKNVTSVNLSRYGIVWLVSAGNKYKLDVHYGNDRPAWADASKGMPSDDEEPQGRRRRSRSRPTAMPRRERGPSQFLSPSDLDSDDDLGNTMNDAADAAQHADAAGKKFKGGRGGYTGDY